MTFQIDIDLRIPFQVFLALLVSPLLGFLAVKRGEYFHNHFDLM
jgi:hypothetical protein